MTFVKFPSIENFASMHHNLKKNIFVNERPVINYRGKIKLHGTNAGIHIKLSEDSAPIITAMKRTSFVTPEDDNAGFARWVEENKTHFERVPFSSLAVIDELTIFGEWAGPGVQKNDAVSKISQKTFFVFGIRVGNTFITSPTRLKFMVIEKEDVKILPWATAEFKVDFSQATDVHKFVDAVNVLVVECGVEDPYVKETFNVEGPGEGFVFYPLHEWGGDSISMDKFMFVFKAKSEAHSQSGNKTKAAEVDPVLHDNAARFASEYVTDARLHQALSEAGVDLNSATPEDTGKILKWIGQDVHKESAASLEANGMEWKQVASAVTHQARHKFFKLLENR